MSNELFDKVNKYANDIINKKLIACEKHIWACERYKKDFSNENNLLIKSVKVEIVEVSEHYE